MAKNTNQRTTTRINQTQRRQQIMVLATAGYTHQQIANRFSVSRARISQIITKELKDATTHNATEYRTLHNQRLEQLHRALAPKIDDGDPQAIATAVRVLERQAKLNGLDLNETRLADAAETQAENSHKTTQLVELVAYYMIDHATSLSYAQRCELNQTLAAALTHYQLEPTAITET